MIHVSAARRVASQQCPVCTDTREHDDWNTLVRGEKPLQRADRAYNEILQEVRVAQTGVQILFAFLLAMAFTSRFKSITPFQQNVYIVTLLLCAAAAAMLIAPAAFHRMVYRQRLKQHLVRIASRLALGGLVLLMLSLVSAVLLIMDVVLSQWPAVVITSAVFAWFLAWWFVLPAVIRLRHRGLMDELPRLRNGSKLSPARAVRPGRQPAPCDGDGARP
jgi:hypothetical protein